MPAGTIDRIYFEFVKGQTKDDNLPIEGFNVYADATTAPGSERRIRWSWKGTYIIITDPAALTIGNPPTPLACAENCICCTCWVSEREVSPILANQGFLGSNKLNRNFMTFLIANNIRFFEKYRIEIEQMEVSQPVFDFLQGVRGQVDNASSLFQPPFFELKGNIKSAASPAAVIGIFSANAVTRKSIYIYQSDIPYVIYAYRPIGDCRAVAPNSVNVQPPFWE